MKRHFKLIVAFILCAVICFTGSVKAASLKINSISASQIMGVNTFRMNLPQNINFVGIVGKHPGVEYRRFEGASSPDGDGSFRGANENSYWMYRFTSKDCWISAEYTNVGWFNDGNGEKPVSAIMTLTNFHNDKGFVTNDGALVGFNKKGLVWILLNNGGGDGLYSDVQIYFFYTGDSEKQPIDMGEAYVGVGGQNSEKRVWNGNEGDNDGRADIFKNEFSTKGTDHQAGIEGRQWEWVSYDNYLKGKTLQVYNDRDCILQYVRAGEWIQATDMDRYSKDYGWGIASSHCTFDVPMQNPTGYNVLSNAGDRHDSKIDSDINNFNDSKKWANDQNDKIMYMVQMGRVTNYATELAELKHTTGRKDGKPFSVYNFTSGKDVGSIELGLSPMALGTEIKKPGKVVDKAVVHEQESIKYTITQQVGNMNDGSKRIDQRTKFTKFVMTDPLPKEVEFVSAVVKAPNGTTIAAFSNGKQTSGAADCTITYSASSHTVTYSFTANYLANKMQYVGETYKFEINTKATNLHNTDSNDYIASNKATVAFGTAGTPNYESETEIVHTQIIYDILTKGVNTTISEMITEIKGGEDNKKVIFTPELGYYVDIVEWQTQTDRYAPSTAQLPNVTDIPSTNKIRIPEEKDGSENTYKHVTTMTDVVPEDERDTLNYDPFGQTAFTYNDVDNNHYIKVISKPMKMVIRISKEDSVTGKETQGDAKFEGAIYTIYRNEALTDIVETVTLDAQGSGSSTELPLGKYWVKETVAPEGYLLDEDVYVIEQTAEQQTAQRLKVSYHDITSYDEIIKGRVSVVKYNEIWGSTEDSPSAGAILRLTLDSNPNVYYDVTLDEKGAGEFYNPVLAQFAPNTIPYGKYTITEVKEADGSEGTYFFIQPEPVDLTDGGDKEFEYRIESDEPVPMHLRIIKTDAVTNKTVTIAGAKFKIWNCQTNSWVRQTVVYPSNIETEVFETNASGEFFTPQELQAGEYIVYEVEAPKGYMLNPEWAIPENEADIGKKDKGGKYVKVDKLAMGVADDTPAQDLELYYEVKMPNMPLMGKLEITKKAEMLSDVTISAAEDFGEKFTPVYVLAGLPGVTYDVIAVADIKSPDGNGTYVTAGTKVDTITTGEDGIATTKDLYLGEYKIVEKSVPAGYIINGNIDNVTLENNTVTEAVVTTKEELVNARQKLKLTFKKEFEDIDFKFDGEIKAIFGVYADEDIENAAGQIVIPKDSLVDVIEYIKSEEDDVTSTIDLPEGKYYVKELKVSFPYTKSEETVKVELKYNNSNDEYVTFPTDKMVNTYDSTTISLIKLPTTVVEDIIVDSQGVVDTDFDEVTEKIMNEIKGLTKEELEDYFEEKGWQGLQGAEYEVYIDETCKTPLLMKNEAGEFEAVTLVSNEFGMMVLEDIPVGTYFLKETKAPAKYEVTKEIIKIETTLQDKDSVAYRVVREDSVIAAEIQKVDIFTGESVPDCVFEIYDKDGNVLMHSITDSQGVGRIAANLFENGETYIFKEIEAPGQYKINTEPQEFVAEFDENGNWISDKVRVDNTRKNIEELIIRKVDDKTGDPLQGCKFSIIVLDENGEPVLDENGENVYLVKEAVTDETGEYIVEKPYYGFYQFIEVQAPEGYELKVDMEGMTFVIDEESPETVIFEVTNTGDIAVYALAAIFGVSLLGILYTIRKNKLATK